MEIYRNEMSNVDLEVPVAAIGGSFEVTAYEGNTLLYTFPTVGAVPGGYRVVLPFSLVQIDRTFEVRWKFDYMEGSARKTYNVATPVEIVTPIIPLSQLAELLSDVSEEDRYEAELVVRKIIEAYTGQSFGKYRGTIDVVGNDSTQLALPRPLLVLNSMSDDLFDYTTSSFVIRGDGWFLGQTPGAYWSIKDAPPEEVLDEFNNGVIYAPGVVKKKDFKYTSYYTINGDWGYEDVPTNVVKAAKLLISDYACQDSAYRDKYLNSMKSADWRIEYTQGAYDGTGNLKADQLLNPYKLSNLVVI
ncbi:head-to-tail adaptor [Streptomyces phage Enygma]